MNSALTARLAYVITGDAKVDETSREGLIGLTRVLAARTSAELGEPVGVDPARDELAFYPLIYWPIAADRPQPKPEARVRRSPPSCAMAAPSSSTPATRLSAQPRPADARTRLAAHAAGRRRRAGARAGAA